MPNLAALYRFRFKESERAQKMLIWKTLCEHYFQRLVGDDKVCRASGSAPPGRR